ncbi:MAG TPA: BNR-4 repeat-containing protein [Verrucomicrobiota bacterium]|nr:BNR-4 repeat-containing protein [Verrucomicrobiota bacterium]
MQRALTTSRVLGMALLAVAGLAAATHEATDPAAGELRPAATRSERSGFDDGYRGIWFTLGQVSEYGDKYSGGLGTYTANHVPLAVYAPRVNRTFFVYGGTVKGQRHLLIMAAYYDHTRHVVPRPTIVHDKQGVNDPHDNASLALDDQGHLWVFISGRGRTRPGFKYRSLRPWDVSAFECLEQGEFTYPQPWHVAGRGFVHLFTQYTRGRELYWETSPDGVRWSEPRKLAGLGGHYQVSAEHQGKIGSFFNRHPGGNVDRRTDLYYVQTVDGGTTWTTVDGRELPVPLAEADNPARVIDYSAQGRLMYTMDLRFDPQGHPVMLYLTASGYQPGPKSGPRDWTVTRWTGAAWETHVVCQSDHNYDLGSLFLGDSEWTILGPTEPGPQPHGTGGDVALWVSRDKGQTWSMRRQVTRDSQFNHAYVRRALNARDPFCVFWADGDPNQLSVSRLYFGDSTGVHYWQLPYDMPGESATPIAINPAPPPAHE